MRVSIYNFTEKKNGQILDLKCFLLGSNSSIISLCMLSVSIYSWLVLAFMACILAVTMQAPKEVPPDLQCKDKFLLQSVVAPDGATTKDITPEMVWWFCCSFGFCFGCCGVLGCSSFMDSDSDLVFFFFSLTKWMVRSWKSSRWGLFTFLLTPHHLSLKNLKKILLPGHQCLRMGIKIVHCLML